MPTRSGGRYEIRDGEPVLVARTDHHPEPTLSAPAQPDEPLTEDDDDADA